MRARRRVRRLVGPAAALLLTAGIVAGAAAPAWAHANLVGSNPGSGAELDEPPGEIRLRFSERVTVAPDGMSLRDSTGAVVATEPASVAAQDPTTVVLPVPADLPDGSYVVSFRVVSADSHPVGGAIVFGVGVPAGSIDEATLDTDDPAVTAVFAVARWTGYAGLALLAGGLSVFALCWPGGWSHPRARRVVAAGWVASLTGAVAVLFLQGPYSAGRSLAGIADPALLSATLETDYGRYVLARLALMAAAGALLAAGARWRAPAGRTAGALVVGVALPATWVGTGHANTSDNPWDVVAAVAHLVAMSSWFGGLALLAICLLPRSAAPPAEQAAPALRRFSLLATGAVVTLVGTGVYIAWRRVGTLEALLGTPYGRLLAFKLAVLGVLLWLGAMSRAVVQRRYAHPAVAVDGQTTGAGRSKRRAARADENQEHAARSQLHQSVRLETGTAMAVLAVVAVLVATPPGVVVTAADQLAAADTGPVLDEQLIGTEGGVTVLVDPARVGENRVVMNVVDMGGQPWDVPEVRASFVLPEGDLGRLPVDLTETGPGVYQSDDAQLPIAGDWRLEIVVRTTEIDSTTVRVAVPVA